ncbi:MAG: DUF4145 domain-containing protein [Mesorhizobium sp.]|uniref:DUF4145 domain-containing protein n=1 Tax=Mesorhizobium sp. TaxID=1871066 RepID=UPI00121901EE|nr:DUF4145 domain-containing protein [Mesorhizobium sp.]TIR23972.1 MAG: DUF4145 domain-containing protein [Mesorhizobium sp.]
MLPNDGTPMGSLVADCIECNSKKITMTLVAYSCPTSPRNQGGGYPFGYVFAVCSHCEKPLIFTVHTSGNASWPSLAELLRTYCSGGADRNLNGQNVLIAPFFSRLPDTQLPNHIPQDVGKALTQAETNFLQAGHEEAAATMYRRALERALKATHPGLPGALASQIKELVRTGVMPKAMGDWADEIRVIGNDGAHDDQVERSDLIAARGFCDAFLKYLITLPKEVEIRRQSP